MAGMCVIPHMLGLARFCSTFSSVHLHHTVHRAILRRASSCTLRCVHEALCAVCFSSSWPYTAQRPPYSWTPISARTQCEFRIGCAKDTRPVPFSELERVRVNGQTVKVSPPSTTTGRELVLLFAVRCVVQCVRACTKLLLRL